MLLVVEQTDTLAKCVEFQQANKNGVYFFFNPKPWSLDMFSSIIMPMVVQALTREFNCAWFRSKDVPFHLKYIPDGAPNGILIFHDGKFKAHMDIFNQNEFVELLEKMPTMGEHRAKPAEVKPVKVAPTRNYPEKNYDFKAIKQCIIL